jgi:hypothetical protein
MRGAGWWVVAVLEWGAGCAGRQDEPESLIRAREVLRTAEAPRGDVLLKCEPSDGEVYLDGVIQGLCSDFAGAPVGLTVGEGLHRIEVKKEGFWPYTTYFEPSGARAVLRIQLQPRTSPGGGAQ